jgi:endonuclease III
MAQSKVKALKSESTKSPTAKQLQKLADHEAEIRRMAEVLKILKRAYPEATCSLDHKNDFELLIATILSAQCTDERVNKTTPALFARYPTAEAMAKANLQGIEKLIKSCGFYKNKALALKGTANEIMKKHWGKVPNTLEKLITLPGVGRKTANVVLGNIFDVPGLVVDTHVKRLTYRMGFTCQTSPEKIEQEMMTLVPKEDWVEFSHLLIYHGRAICDAKKPLCEECPVARYCPKIGVV